MILANHPYANAMGAYPMGLPANGWTLGGRFSDFEATAEDNGTYLFSWEIESIGSNAYAVYIFKNGSFLLKTRDTNWTFVPDVDSDRWSFEFIVLPNEANYEDPTFFTADNLKDMLKLTYDIDGAVEKVEICKNSAVGDDVDYTDPVKSYQKALITIVGTDYAFLAGSWPKQATKYAEITVTIDFSGGPDVAQFHWTWGAVTSDTFIVRDYAQDIQLNGLRLSFDSDHSWTEGDTFTIKIQHREDYTSSRLANGLHTFGVITRNKANLATYSDEASYTLSAIPRPPVVETDLISYTNGTGSVKVFWTMPADVDVDTVYIYRNYPNDENGADNVNFPISKETVSPGQLYDYTVSNLQPGLNKIWARCSGDGGTESNFIAGKYELNLDSSLNAQTVPNPPYDFELEIQTDLTVTINVYADSTSDTVTIYHDNQTGTVDYNSPFATISNPQTSDNIKLTSTGLYLADGDYIFAVRATSGSVEETNTSTRDFTVDTTLAAKATSLALEVV